MLKREKKKNKKEAVEKKTVQLSAFSLSGYCLPSYSKGVLTIKRSGPWWNRKVEKWLTFQHYPNCNPDIDDLVIEKIRIK